MPFRLRAARDDLAALLSAVCAAFPGVRRGGRELGSVCAAVLACVWDARPGRALAAAQRTMTYLLRDCGLARLLSEGGAAAAEAALGRRLRARHPDFSAAMAAGGAAPGEALRWGASALYTDGYPRALWGRVLDTVLLERDCGVAVRIAEEVVSDRERAAYNAGLRGEAVAAYMRSPAGRLPGARERPWGGRLDAIFDAAYSDRVVSALPGGG